MTIKQVKTGWQVNIQPGGRGAKRVKKTVKTKADALAWERHVRAKVQESPDWAPIRKDARPLSELCTLWFNLHGQGLRAGANTHSRLQALCVAMDDPRAETFTAEMFAKYRTQRLAAGISANNMNREHAYLRAVFNELMRLGHWKRENPLKLLRSFKVQQWEGKHLTHAEIKKLLPALRASKNPHAELIAKVCLSTGARWGEAETLTVGQVKNSAIQFTQTKSSKNRSVPITEALQAELLAHHKANGVGQRVFTSAYSAFREGVDRAELGLPKGQLSHVLRHTFASHFMMSGGNILALQKALGHQSLNVTMRYAHLSPDHLAEARTLNPLATMPA